jgi:hypothetical protein
VKKKINERIMDQRGLVEPVLGYPGEYSHGVPSKIVRAN